MLLTSLAAQHPCIIVSGRTRQDILGKLGSIKVERVIGNHGAETEATARTSRHRAPEWKTLLAHDLASLPGVWLEDK